MTQPWLVVTPMGMNQFLSTKAALMGDPCCLATLNGSWLITPRRYEQLHHESHGFNRGECLLSNNKILVDQLAQESMRMDESVQINSVMCQQNEIYSAASVDMYDQLRRCKEMGVNAWME